MTRASYSRAVELLALCDDVAWAYADDLVFPPAATLVATLFDQQPRILAFDVRMFRTRQGLDNGSARHGR